MGKFFKDALILGVISIFYSGSDMSALIRVENNATEPAHIMHEKNPCGMQLLLKVDENIIKDLELFIDFIAEVVPQYAELIRLGGRIILVGSGPGARIGIDIAANCRSKFLKAKEHIKAVTAGGDSALIKSKEGFEDSEADGESALKDYNLGPKDTVILISESGSSSFNVGCGHFSANMGANVLYFFNSKNIPSRTKRLFDRKVNPVIPICIDIGPPIEGSTPLQGATLTEACLEALLASTFYLSQGEELLSKEYPRKLLLKVHKESK